MKTVLMVLTHDRQDCLQLCLDRLRVTDSLRRFDKVVLLLNGVPRPLRRFVDRFTADNPQASWDFLEGPGTRPEGISWLENRCVEKYPGCTYVKVDEDIFVPQGWAERMLQAYEANRDRPDLALITPLIPNNAYGLHWMLTRLYTEHLEEHRRRFGCDPSPEPKGLTWQSPAVGEWATRLFLDLERANAAHRELLAERRIDPYHAFCKYFSIGCIAYDYGHWQRMGGIPRTDEPGWCTWIEEHSQTNILDVSQIVLHYSFFVQQEWLDRTSLLEDLRMVNVPGSLPRRSLRSYYLPRWSRIARQLPGIARRRLGFSE